MGDSHRARIGVSSLSRRPFDHLSSGRSKHRLQRRGRYLLVADPERTDPGKRQSPDSNPEAPWGSWELCRTIKRNAGSRSFGHIVLDRSGMIMALSTAELGVQLVETGSGHTLATLAESGHSPICFSPDSGQLLTIDPGGAYYIWD